ncbi:hypothetical protein QKQ66_gp004 [Dione juno nucleopolyhedrovirus]|uniref:Uncharacterized protein n=1 Tax=Dione juno nucleopolyhedrovirus TaxID=2594175 RepID=A0AAE6H3D2_9ABAC|nr:hypothetical protein QKQ66_gp004 [Dione juno nucleopolyhedrovirus]QDL57006.1 hypothetical protein DijuNPV-ORF-4 [Dione juno nucleopolyhedrovirus]
MNDVNKNKVYKHNEYFIVHSFNNIETCPSVDNLDVCLNVKPHAQPALNLPPTETIIETDTSNLSPPTQCNIQI